MAFDVAFALVFAAEFVVDQLAVIPRLQLLSLLLHDMGRRGHVKRRGINRTTTTTTTTAAAAVAIVADISVTSVTAFMGCGVGI